MRRSIVLAGVRPTERMILGHLIGFLKDLIGREAEARCFFMIADYQALRMDREHPRKMESNVRKLVTDLLAAGFDPERSVCFLQSQVPQLAELAMILHYSIPLPAHAGDPEARRKRDAASRSPIPGFGGYPVFQPAAVLLFRPSIVAAGPGQRMRSNLCREVARRFNRKFGTVFPLPGFEQSLQMNGTRGNTGIRMSHSNTVGLADADGSIRTRTNSAARAPRTDAEPSGMGTTHMDHSLPPASSEQAAGGKSDAKQEPFRTAGTQLEGSRSLVGDVLHLGGSEARIEGQRTLEVVKKAVGLRYGSLMG